MNLLDEINQEIDRLIRLQTASIVDLKIEVLRGKVDKDSDYARGIVFGQLLSARAFDMKLEELRHFVKTSA